MKLNPKHVVLGVIFITLFLWILTPRNSQIRKFAPELLVFSREVVTTTKMIEDPFVPMKSLDTSLPEELPSQFQRSDGLLLELALDEAMIMETDGKQHLISFSPIASIRELRKRLNELNACPVAYPAGKKGYMNFRHIITRDISVKLAEEKLASLLKNHDLILKEQPKYAPGWVILSAVDSFSALAVIDKIRFSSAVMDADILVGRHQFRKAMPNDSLISQQWHLKNNHVVRTHANVDGVWNYPNATGIRGSGIRIGIIDDGIELTHPDLVSNLDTVNDRDFIQNDNDPSPGIADDAHGTACAGVAAARGNNSLGVSGVAPLGNLVGLRLIADTPITGAQEADAMGWRNDLIQVKSNSWGPGDSGEELISHKPSALFLDSLSSATSQGRDGKGTIFVWAAGNGGSISTKDNSNYDGYSNSIYTIAVGASNSDGGRSEYSEAGANLVVCAPSSGSSTQLEITTTDRTSTAGYNPLAGVAGNYANDFGGTSSATPVVSGTIALMLEKNPNLGWRDVQEILMRSAFKISPTDRDWATNSGGMQFNHNFGAGLVDATSAVNLAQSWTNLSAKTTLTSTQSKLSVSIPDNNPNGITRTFKVTNPLRVEHVTLLLNTTHPNHRNLNITLTSPSGMSSQMGVAASGKNGETLTGWTFSSVRHWGENSSGDWILKITDVVSGNAGSLQLAELTLHGSPSTPINQAPQILAANLSAGVTAYADTPITIHSVITTDQEGDSISLQYQWQSSFNGVDYVNDTVTSATLPANPLHAGRLWRCVITASDGLSSSTPFLTSFVNLLTRPIASVAPGGSYLYPNNLVLPMSEANMTRQAIFNEFSQGPLGGNSEWIEILTLKAGSFRNWLIRANNGRQVIFKDSAAWDNIPAGTLIVIYNEKAKDNRIPTDDMNPSDGIMILSSKNQTYFDGASENWIALTNSGGSFTLLDKDSRLVHGISYGNINTESPYLSSVGDGQSAFFNSNKELDANLGNTWTIVSQASSTPAKGNNTVNTAFITAIQNGSLNMPALFRLGSGIQLPAGLTLNSTTGLLSGTVSATAIQKDYLITIERYNTTPAVISQSFTLKVADIPKFSKWITSFTSITNQSATGDPDGDGIPNLLEYALNQNPASLDRNGAIVFDSREEHISITYRVSKLHTDVSIVPEWSINLDGSTPWSNSGITMQVLDDQVESQELRAILAIDPSVPKRFMRLRAILNP